MRTLLKSSCVKIRCYQDVIEREQRNGRTVDAKQIVEVGIDVKRHLLRCNPMKK